MKRVGRQVIVAALLAATAPSVHSDCNSNLPRAKPDSRYVDNGDGTVTDSVTGLMWKQCAEGLTAVDGTCTGTAATFSWREALQRAVDVNAGSSGEALGYTDWRLPNINELKSLVETACFNPSMNTTLFPTELYPSQIFWSSSSNTYADNVSTQNYQSSYAWRIYFEEGVAEWGPKYMAYRVRMVRDVE